MRHKSFSTFGMVLALALVVSAAAAAAPPSRSRNGGEKFELLVGGVEVLCAAFDLDGKSLWFSSYSGTAALARIALAPGAKAEALTLPALKEDAIAYIAQNSGRRSEMAIASFKRSVFLSKAHE